MTQLLDTDFKLKYSYLLTRLSKENIISLENWISNNENEYNEITKNIPLHSLSFWDLKNTLENLIINRHFYPCCDCLKDIKITESYNQIYECDICSPQFALEIVKILNN